MPFSTNRSNNPLLRRAFANRNSASPVFANDRMSLEGTVNKTGLLLVAALLAALYPWTAGNDATYQMCALLGSIGGFVLAMIVAFRAQWSPVLAIPYALFEGAALGGLSAILERRYPGIAIESVALTFGTLAVMLLAYRAGLIRATARFRAVIIAATGSIALLYLVSFILSLFHIVMPFLYSSSPLSIIVSLVIVVIAALNLILDFDLIESGVRSGAPRYLEWYSAFSLLVTLVWLYTEILRLLAKARRD